jgi:hypothetical protein
MVRRYRNCDSPWLDRSGGRLLLGTCTIHLLAASGATDLVGLYGEHWYEE